MNKIFHPNIDELYGYTSTCCGTTLTLVEPLGVAPFVWTLSIRHGHRCSVSRSPSSIAALHPTVHIIDMINIFEVFLPQLLRYPNPSDPLNGEAAALLMRHPKEYEQRVKGADGPCHFGLAGADWRRNLQNTYNGMRPKRQRIRPLQRRTMTTMQR